jgi:multidrug resistance efflux pump
LDGFEGEQARDQLVARQRQLELTYKKALASAPIDLQRQREQVTVASATVVQAHADLRAALVERGLNPNADSVLQHYATGAVVALDRVVSQVRSAQAAYRGEVALLRSLELGSLDRQREQAELDDLRAQIAGQQERLARLTVYSPSDGVVLTENLSRLVGAEVQAGAVLLEVGNVSHWQAVLQVPGGDISTVSAGDSVRIELDAFRQDKTNRIDGIVAFVGPQPIGTDPTSDAATATSGGGNYRVDVKLDPDEVVALGNGRLRRGYSVQARIVTRSGNALRLLRNYFRSQFNF